MLVVHRALEQLLTNVEQRGPKKANNSAAGENVKTAACRSDDMEHLW